MYKRLQYLPSGTFFSLFEKNMHRRWLIFLAVLLSTAVIFFLQKNVTQPQNQNSPLPETINQISPKPSINPATSLTGSIFYPYWTLPNALDTETPLAETTSEDFLIYFGVQATESGIDTSEQGYKSLQRFLSVSKRSQTPKLLTIRMLDEDINQKIFDSPQAQDQLINDIAELIHDDFDGIVLDLEHSVIPFPEVTQDISIFTSNMSTAIHSQNKLFTIAIFGDTFYRERPYDIKKMNEYTDYFFVMSYDFHKSRGEPGPPFPLNTKDEPYSYSFTTMLDDFTRIVPPEKLIITHGLFGYDWPVDAENRPLTSGKALTYAQIKPEYLDSCTHTSCNTRNLSTNPHITYTINNEQHDLWFESPLSVLNKSLTAQTYGISKVAFWAYGYY